MKIDIKKYPDIQVLDEITKIKAGLWYASGSKNGYYTSSMANTKKEALRILDLHLSYVTEDYINF
jgi:hypothetical protein